MAMPLQDYAAARCQVEMQAAKFFAHSGPREIQDNLNEAALSLRTHSQPLMFLLVAVSVIGDRSKYCRR